MSCWASSRTSRDASGCVHPLRQVFHDNPPIGFYNTSRRQEYFEQHQKYSARSLMQVAPEVREVCTALSKFRVPAAVVDQSHDRFVTWNKNFEKTLGVMASQIEQFRPGEIVRPVPPAEDADATSYHHPCELVHPAIAPGVTGQSFHDGKQSALLILNTFALDRETDGFVRGVLVGQQTTRDHLKQTFHDTVSQQVMAATFAVEMFRGKLEGDAVANSKEVTAISTLLQSLFTDIQTALNFQPAYPSGDRPSEN